MDDLVIHLRRLSGDVRDGRHENFRYDHGDLRRVWQSAKIKADPKAIANFDSLPRPLKPPGRL